MGLQAARTYAETLTAEAAACSNPSAQKPCTYNCRQNLSPRGKIRTPANNLTDKWSL